MNLHAFRLKTGDDLKKSIETYTAEQSIAAGFVITCVGSLSVAVLRMAGAQPEKQDIRKYTGHFEIVSLVGTVSVNGYHLHMSISDENGQVIGGHLKEGNIIDTTAELVIGEDGNAIYERALDEVTGFDEFVVKPKV